MRPAGALFPRVIAERILLPLSGDAGKTTNDLEAATKTITEVTEQATPDYSSALTSISISDARLAILRMAARLNVTIDSMTAAHLYCRVYIDTQDTAHRLFDMDWTSTGDKLTAVDFTSGVILAALKDGASHTFKFFFWVDAGNAVISLVQLWTAPGTCSTSVVIVATFTGQGEASITGWQSRYGTGTATLKVGNYIINNPYRFFFSATGGEWGIPAAVIDGLNLMMYGTVATDLNALQALAIFLRREA